MRREGGRRMETREATGSLVALLQAGCVAKSELGNTLDRFGGDVGGEGGHGCVHGCVGCCYCRWGGEL